MTIEALGHETTIEKCQQIAELISRRTDSKGNGIHGTAIASLEFTRQSDTFTSMHDVSEPILAIVVQGKKAALLGEETYHYGVAQYLVISVDLPLSGFVTEATPDRPYLGLKLDLDPVQLCDIIAQTTAGAVKKESVKGWFVTDATLPLIDCALKLVKLLDSPQDIPFLAPLIIREIYYRLLVSEQSEAVRQIATSGSSGFVTEATPDRPYLGLKLDLDPVQLCDIIAQTTAGAVKKESVKGWFVTDATLPLIDCALKLVKLLDSPQDIPFLAPLIIREIYYRLLVSEQSEAVRQIATSGSNMQNIARAIKIIKTNFAKPMRIEDLAEQVNLSSSSLHRHFKAVTSMSPLQYQKQIRLLNARHLMLAENADAATTAYQVGYESPSQFSREYSRMFGAPPIKDIERLRIV